MKYSYAYHTRSRFADGVCSLAPNLEREPVAFDASLRDPLRFREAISALHDVVISDLRFKPRDKTSYEEWKKDEGRRQQAAAQVAREQARAQFAAAQKVKIPGDIEKAYEKARSEYWHARDRYSKYLEQHDQELLRLLVPYDPVITVAEDVVFFECFSADESSYGCLSVERTTAFGRCASLQLGTTNVDYSWDLFHQFQAMRSYRETRFVLDPGGFTVRTDATPEYREGKIDLPPGWLRGLMQVQGAMTLPMRRVSLGRDAVYSLLAWLRRHKAPRSPRALRFELLPGAPALVLEPWEVRIPVRAGEWVTAPQEPIRIWGRQRLLSLARLLPLAESIDVHLLGTGLPSFWVVRMGSMRLTLGLSGWTMNDWTRGSALDLLAPPVSPAPAVVQHIASILKEKRSADFAHIARHSMVDDGQVAAALKHLAHSGQVIFDLPHGVYRWRQIMSQVVGESEMGAENEEQAASRILLARDKGRIEKTEAGPNSTRLLTGKVESKPVELLLDADGTIRRGKCLCGHHRMAGLRAGPCRHLLTLRALALRHDGAAEQTPAAWYHRLTKLAGE
ncbi:MAG TPA: hypothetical protein VG796_06240 [Verrucomicrobiales bacterium]|nr:hypothetical protein [Verrucomicrobiales bacterium]